MTKRHVWALVAILVAGCNQDESGVIANKAPFFQKGYNLPLNEAPKVVAQTREFAEKRGIKLLVSTQHFRDGEFSTTLVTKDMNIILNNVAMGDNAWLTAIARDDPSNENKALLNQYIGSIGLGPATGDKRPPLVPPSG
jgi:hypothetical protein